MLFEVPGLNLGDPKVDDGRKEKAKKLSSEVKKPSKTAAKPTAPVTGKKVQKSANEPVPSKSASTVIQAPSSLSIFKSAQKTKLQRKMEEKLMGSRFRYLNQKLYESDSKEALQHFKQNPEDFKNYHEGFKSQVAHWPVNPVDLLMEGLRKDLKATKSTPLQVADMGCGEAKIMAHFEGNSRIKVNSFDLAAAQPGVIVADMTRVPLPNQSMDVVIFCLSLMNTNFLDALREARRILKANGALRIAEVESRFTDGPGNFVSAVEALGFAKVNFDKSNRVFWLFEFKISEARTNGIPINQIQASAPLLKPCLYKKR